LGNESPSQLDQPEHSGAAPRDTDNQHYSPSAVKPRRGGLFLSATGEKVYPAIRQHSFERCPVKAVGHTDDPLLIIAGAGQERRSNSVTNWRRTQ
jgi:hypothetical protein